MTFEDVSGRGLLLQRLFEVARPRLHLVEQARVLDRDRGLIGEGLGELDLALGEGVGLRAPEAENPDKLAVAHQGDHDERDVSRPIGRTAL